jgi:hypothetical protein
MDMVKLKTVEFYFHPCHFLPVGHHAGIATVQLSHFLIDNEVRVSMDVKPQNPELGSNVRAVDQGLILGHIIGSAEVHSTLLRVKEPSKYMLQCS